jgi:GAF domain-containing protein
MSDLNPEKFREMNRIAELRAYGILDTPNEAAFDQIVKSAATALGAPIALISFVDEHRQWFKARHGIEAQETPRTISFCTHAIHGQDVFVVNDAQQDQRFTDNPLVTGDPHVRFYAGAPLRTDQGRRIGTLCVIDPRPRNGLSDEGRRRLQSLADEVMQAVEARTDRPRR